MDQTGKKKHDDLTQKVVPHFFQQLDFGMIAGARAGIPNKPYPAGTFIIAEKFGISPGEFLYLGDTRIVMKADAQAALLTRSLVGVGRTGTE